jgi:glycosyltransferase involved in cell wall biosynthesis
VLIDPDSVESIATGMRRVLEDQALRSELVAAGRERSRDFTWRRCAASTIAVLERVSAGPRGADQRALG